MDLVALLSMKPCDRKPMNNKTTDIRLVKDRWVWDCLTDKSEMASFMQGWDWGELKRQFGWTIARFCIFDDNNSPIVGIQMMLRRRAAFLEKVNVGLAYIPRGPIGDLTDTRSMALLDYARLYAKSQGASFLRVEPEHNVNFNFSNILISNRYKRSSDFVQIRHTGHIDLVPNLDQIIAGFKSKTRYNIRLGIRKGVTVRKASKYTDFQSFYDNTVETGYRDGFAVHSKDYYYSVWQSYNPKDGALFIASYGDEDVASLLVIKSGEVATYLYGASSSRYRNMMPSHVLQWEAIKWAQEMGCRIYDLWGMDDPEDDSDPMRGVGRFKHGFNPTLIAHPGTYDFVINKYGYFFINKLLIPLRSLISSLHLRRDPRK